MLTAIGGMVVAALIAVGVVTVLDFISKRKRRTHK